MASNLTQKTLKGIGWSTLAQTVYVLFQFVIGAVLARLLSPADFGLQAMVLVFSNFIFLFRDLGLNAAIIQRKDLTEEHVSSSFWMYLVLGLILTAGLSAGAPAIANFYQEARLVPVTIWLSTTFLISSVTLVQYALFSREMKFKTLAFLSMASFVTAGIVAVIMAWRGWGVWSLVAQSLVNSVMGSLLAWLASPWRPKRIFRWAKLKDLLGFGLNRTGFNLVNYFSRNFDNLLIGKYLGMNPLGFYNLAYKLLLFPINNISQVINRVMFSSFSSIQEDIPRIQNGYLKAARYTALVTFPLMIGLSITAAEFVEAVYGPQWQRSVFIVRILSLVGMFQAVAALNGVIFQSQGRSDIQFRVGCLFALVTGISFVIGLRWDIEGVSVAYGLVSAVLLVPGFTIALRLIKLSFFRLLRELAPVIFANFGMGAVVIILRIWLISRGGNSPEGQSPYFLLAACSSAGAAAYPLFLLIFDRKFFLEALGLLRKSCPSA